MKSDNEWINIVIQTLKPRSVYTTMFFAAFLWGTIEGAIEPHYLITIVTTLFGYWFDERSGKAQANGSK